MRRWRPQYRTRRMRSASPACLASRMRWRTPERGRCAGRSGRLARTAWFECKADFLKARNPGAKDAMSEAAKGTQVTARPNPMLARRIKEIQDLLCQCSANSGDLLN